MSKTTQTSLSEVGQRGCKKVECPACSHAAFHHDSAGCRVTACACICSAREVRAKGKRLPFDGQANRNPSFDPPHLWEVEHPYYCGEATYFQNCHVTHRSAHELLEDFGPSDADLNFVVRWDWLMEEGENVGTFQIAIVVQRKGFLSTHSCPVTKDDEPALRAWLEKRWQTVLQNWSPIV